MTTEEKILMVMKEDLDIRSENTISTFETDLFGLGMNSLLFIKLLVALEKRFGVEFSEEFMSYEGFRTIRDIAEYIDSVAEGRVD